LIIPEFSLAILVLTYHSFDLILSFPYFFWLHRFRSCIFAAR